MKYKIYILFILTVGLVSCQKEFLSEKTDKALLIPKSLRDFQSLMDNLSVFNISPVMPDLASDDFFTTAERINNFSGRYEKNAYIWADDIDGGVTMSDWNVPYQQVFYSNVVLDGLMDYELKSNEKQEFDRIKGSALFHRAFAFYNLVQLYAKPFDKSTASSILGIPIRLTADVNEKSVRASLQQTYERIIVDLKEAEILLPLSFSFSSRPNKVAVQALLARIYLSMEEYELALHYANEVLKINSTLIDYNTLSKTSSSPFPLTPNIFNTEILFYSKTNSYSYSTSTNTTVEPNLYLLYNNNDLRRTIYFTGANPISFKGRYTGNIGALFSGLTTSEIFLIKAECEARIGDYLSAMSGLNALLKTRYINTAPYISLNAENKMAALKIILEERRKELVFRGLRWSDLRRLNRDINFQVTITRVLDGETYTLLPNSNRYTFPIPTIEVLRSGIQQNPR